MHLPKRPQINDSWIYMYHMYSSIHRSTHKSTPTFMAFTCKLVTHANNARHSLVNGSPAVTLTFSS